MKAERNEELRQQYANASRQMMHEAQVPAIEAIMIGKGEKRREEDANPKPRI